MEKKFDDEVKLDKKKNKEDSATKVLQVAKSIQKDRVRKDTSEKTLGLCNKSERRLCTQERKDILDVEERERESERICGEAVEKRVYQTLKVTPDFTSILCREKG